MSRRNVIVVAASCVLLLAAWWMLLWSPKGDELREAADRRTVAEDRAEALEVRLARLQDAQAESPRLLATRDRLRSAIPESPSLAQFILDANDAANAAGVDFLSISPAQPTPPATPGTPSEIKLDLRIEGGYFALLDYLDRLLDLPRIVVIDNLSVTPEQEAAGSPNLAVSISARMFTVQGAGLTGSAGGTSTSVPTGGGAEAVAAPLAPTAGGASR